VKGHSLPLIAGSTAVVRLPPTRHGRGSAEACDGPSGTIKGWWRHRRPADGWCSYQQPLQLLWPGVEAQAPHLRLRRLALVWLLAWPNNVRDCRASQLTR